MAHRRILSLWFPRLGAERLLRQRKAALPLPFAVVGDRGPAQVLVSVNPEAEAAGLRLGQPLRDATAMCPALITAPQNLPAEAAFLRALRRWAGKFSPWVAEEAPDALVIDVTGCTHLFGGEAGLVQQMDMECADLGLTLRTGLADTRGAAWALARHGGQDDAGPRRNGDAIRQEAHATRSRAADRRGGAWDAVSARLRHDAPSGVIAPAGHTRQMLAGLPLAALRIEAPAIEALARLGLRRVDDIAGLPRAALARRFGADVLRRLDQAFGVEPEPVNPAANPPHFAVRISFPDPIGLIGDVTAGLDRLLPPLCEKLRLAGRGARRVRLEAQRVDGRVETVEVGLARAAHDPERIRPLLVLRLDSIDAGFGIDRLRLEAAETEPQHAVQHRGHLEASAAVAARAMAGDTALEDLIGKLGARLTPEAVLRLHPAQSNLPEKTATTLSAAWSEAAPEPWPHPRAPRPVVIFPPEMVDAPDEAMPPATFRWRRRALSVRVAIGPERLLPEWWLDDPNWRSGPRDYWRIEVEGGERLWLFYAHGGEVSGGWFCHGRFA